jgi:hypothetical protein
MSVGPWDARTEAWVTSALERHAQAFERPEFLKAIRALSVRYVERRRDLARRSPIDSSGKRAAFAGFFAPLHFVTTLAALEAIAVQPRRRVVDLGTGTGVVGAACAIAGHRDARLLAVDKDAWSLAEARWNFEQLGISGQARRGDLVRTAAAMAAGRGRLSDLRVTIGWAVNELADAERHLLLESLSAIAMRGAALLVLEPLAGAVTPWWPQWSETLAKVGGRTLIGKWAWPLPDVIRRLDEEAGFDRETLSAKVLWVAEGGS